MNDRKFNSTNSVDVYRLRVYGLADLRGSGGGGGGAAAARGSGNGDGAGGGPFFDMERRELSDVLLC